MAVELLHWVSSCDPIDKSVEQAAMTDMRVIDGEGVHVGDCHVWAEIFYLDSPTDYREYISKPVSQHSKATHEEFTTLDTETTFLGVLLAIGRSISYRLSRKE